MRRLVGLVALLFITSCGRATPQTVDATGDVKTVNADASSQDLLKDAPGDLTLDTHDDTTAWRDNSTHVDLWQWPDVTDRDAYVRPDTIANADLWGGPDATHQDAYLWPDAMTNTDIWRWPDLYAGNPGVCQSDVECRGMLCCSTPWGIKVCADTCITFDAGLNDAAE